MIELNTALLICLVHVLYYTYFQVIADLMRVGMVHNTPNPTVSRLRTAYKVNILTFQKNSDHHGFAWFKTLYLNENLFRKKKALLWTFHHEHYHLMNKHKRNKLLMRLFFSFTPMLLLINTSIPFIAVYVLSAYLMHYIAKVFEKNATSHANEMIEK